MFKGIGHERRYWGRTVEAMVPFSQNLCDGNSAFSLFRSLWTLHNSPKIYSESMAHA